MTVRIAKYDDIPAIADIMADAHQRSRYAENTTFDPIEAKQLLVRSIQRHGHQNYMGSMVLVSETDGEIRGFMLCILDLVYPCLKELKATDLFFLFQPGAEPRDARSMVLTITEWARRNPKVIECVLGATNAIGDWRRTAKLYEGCGFVPSGGLFEIEFDRSEQQAVAGAA